MTVAVVGSVVRTNGTTGPTAVSYSQAPTAGSLLTLDVIVHLVGGTNPAITTPTGYTQESTQANNTGTDRARFARYSRLATGTEGASVSVSHTGTTFQAVLKERSGLDNTTPRDADGTSVSNNGSSAVLSPAVTTVAAATFDDTATAVSGASSGVTFGGGTTQDVALSVTSLLGIATGSQVLASQQTITPTCTWAGGSSSLFFAQTTSYKLLGTAFSRSAALGGGGTLAATVTPAASTAGALAGDGVLSTALTPAASTTGDLAGTGTLGASLTPATGSAADLAGAGALSALTTPSTPATGDLSGDGALGADVLVRTSASAGLSGTGTLAALLSTGFATAGDFGGSGTLQATAVPGFPTSAGLSGVGVLVANVDLVTTSTDGTLAGDGQLTVHLVSQTGAFVSFTSAGQLTALLVPHFHVTAALGGAGTLDAVIGRPEDFTACLVLDRSEYTITLEPGEYRIRLDATELTLEMEHTVPDKIYSSTGDKDYVTGILSSDLSLVGKTIKVGLGGSTPAGVTFIAPDILEIIDDNHARVGVFAGAGAYPPPVLGSAVRLQARVTGTPTQRTVIDEDHSVTFI